MKEEMMTNIENLCHLDETTRPIAEAMLERGYDSKTIAEHINQSHYSWGEFYV